MCHLKRYFLPVCLCSTHQSRRPGAGAFLSPRGLPLSFFPPQQVFTLTPIFLSKNSTFSDVLLRSANNTGCINQLTTVKRSENKQAGSNAIIMWLLPDTTVLTKQTAMPVCLGRKAKWNPCYTLPAGLTGLSPEIRGTATTVGRVAEDFSSPTFFKTPFTTHAASFCIAWKFASWNFPNNFSNSRKTKRKWAYYFNVFHQLVLVAPFWNVLPVNIPHISHCREYQSTCMLVIKTNTHKNTKVLFWSNKRWI